MRNSITTYQFASKFYMHENPDKQNNMLPGAPELTEGKTDLGNEIKPIDNLEKGTNLMHKIWGDIFLSDSLH